MNTTSSSTSPVPFDFEGSQIRVFPDEQGKPEAMLYCRHGHSGYQILWNSDVVGVLRELA